MSTKISQNYGDFRELFRRIGEQWLLGIILAAGIGAQAQPVVSSVSPTTATAGAQVTISGSGFGSAQGTGSVWLGTTVGGIVSWSASQIVATVGSNSTSGVAQVAQGGIWPTQSLSTSTHHPSLASHLRAACQELK